MPLTRDFEVINNVTFFKPMRAIFSGSSQSGKTHLIGKILQRQKRLFGDCFTQVKYFYPEYLEECPVDWHNDIETPISYHRGFPNKEEVLSMPKNSLLIIDDNMKKVVKSELMRQFFNVISGKKQISIICVTQNYFTQGTFCRDIRNSSNYVALFRNCADASLNKRVATAFGLGKSYLAAESDVFQDNVYPYVFIDQSQRAQLSSYRLYTDILGRVKIAYNAHGMKGYVLSEADFCQAYKILETKKKFVTAIANENKKRQSSEDCESVRKKPKRKKRRKIEE